MEINYEEIFTAENLIKAYEETGINPMYHSFRKIIDGCNYGCALTALTAYKINCDENIKNGFEKLLFIEIEKECKTILNLPNDFNTMEFAYGFDKANIYKAETTEYKLGLRLREEFEKIYDGEIINGSEFF